MIIWIKHFMVKVKMLNFMATKKLPEKLIDFADQIASVFSVTLESINNHGMLLFHRITSCFRLLWTRLSDYGTYQEENVSAVSSI